ncbi:MAG: SMC family ATPase [Clostridia bacterium]|nr:SMC family ATPase [Clostridia bacterium]
MRPIRLKFCGINSFSEETEINFEPLTSSGIFGIFGDTGSGKSSILDAINFALFGDVNGREKIEYMNTKCNEAKVDFTFDMKTGSGYKRYEVIRSKVRKKKDPSSGDNRDICLYETDNDGKTTVIANNVTDVGNRIEEILGMSKTEFRMCIALPQGEFAEFLTSSQGKQAQLMQSIFNLTRYGIELKAKLSNLVSSAKTADAVAQSELRPLEKYTADYLDVAKDQLEDVTRQYNEKRAARDDMLAKKGALEAMDEKYAKLTKAEGRLQELSLQKDEMDSLHADLDILPACREVAEKRRKANEAKDELDGLRNYYTDIEFKIKDADDGIESCTKQLDEGNFGDTIDACRAKLNQIKDNKDLPGDLKTKEERLKTLTGQQITNRKEESKLSDRLADEREKAEKARKDADAYTGDDISALLSDDLKDAIFRAGYEDFNEFIVSLSSKIKPYESVESALYSLVQGELTAESEFLLRKITAIPESSLDLDELVARIQNAQETRIALEKAANDADKKASGTEHTLNNLRGEIGRNDNEIKDLNESTGKLKGKIAEIYGKRRDYAAYKKEMENALTTADKTQKQLNSALQAHTRTKTDLQIEQGRLEEKIAQKQKEYDELLGGIKDAIVRSGRENEQQCLDIAEKYRDIADATATLKAYHEEVDKLNILRGDLLTTEGIRDYNPKDLEDARHKYDTLDGETNKLHSSIAVTGNEIETIKEKIGEKKRKAEEADKAAKKLALVTKLNGLLTGKDSFLDFVAEEYLNDIAYDATDMLLTLSGGQFSLAYNGLKFIVHDNFDAGKERGVNTLSGGETFLVSLSLALSLSKATSGKSDRMIEFFFLDEGFGSLDSKLCGEVVDALETVRRTYPQFTIGVISHVEELMNRIGNKITVEKATDIHGSRIHVS